MCSFFIFFNFYFYVETENLMVIVAEEDVFTTYNKFGNFSNGS